MKVESVSKSNSEKIVWVDIKKIKPHPKNRNKHSEEQIERLARIIEFQGWRIPLVVSNASGYLAAGHGRLMAAKRLGLKTIPVLFQDFKDEDQENAFRVSDNEIARWAELDLAGLNEDVVDFSPDFDLDLLGIDGFELEPADKYGDKDADAVPDIKQTDILLGDLFQLGTHRLLCGDSTKKADVERLMNGEKADMVFTSPPYNVGLDYATHDDSMDAQKYKDMLWHVMNNIKAIKADDFAILWNKGVWIHPCDFRLDIELLCSHFDNLNRVISWKKKGITGPPIFAHTQKNPVTKNYMPFFGWEFIFISKLGKRGTKKIPNTVLERRMTDVWEVDQSVDSSNQGNHPGAFPVQLVEDAIHLFCDDIAYEPFSGSGSTLIACEKTNRKCYGMEIDPQYCQVIIDRWEKFTGQKAIQLNKKPKTILKKNANKENTKEHKESYA